jgi:uncharacterized membrane protein
MTVSQLAHNINEIARYIQQVIYLYFGCGPIMKFWKIIATFLAYSSLILARVILRAKPIRLTH